MSVKMNFGNLKYAIGSSRAIKLSKSRGPSSNTEQTSTISLSTKSNVENLLSRKNNQLKPNSDRTEKIIDSNNISLKGIPLGGKNSKSINRIQFMAQSDPVKDRTLMNYNTTNINNNQNNSSSLPRKAGDQLLNSVYRSKHQKTSSEIPRNMTMTNYIFENFHTNRNHREFSNKSKELTRMNNNNISHKNRESVFIMNEFYNNTTNTFNKDKEEMEKVELDLNSNTTNGMKFHKNLIKSIDHRNFSKILNSDKKESKFSMRNVIEIKSEDEQKFESKNETINKTVKEEKLSQNFDYSEQTLMNKELLKTVEILKTYIITIQKVTENKKAENEKKLNKKDEDINKIKEENDAIKKQNNELKSKMLQFLNKVKVYELDEIIREKSLKKCISQLLLENEYLRCSNEKMIGLHHAKESSKQSTKSNHSEKEEKVNSKISHKRQKTQINFTNSLLHINSDTDTSKESKANITTIQCATNTIENYSSVDSSKSDESSVLSFFENKSIGHLKENEQEEIDAFSSALKDMQMNHTVKKTFTDENKDEGPSIFLVSPTANYQKHKPSYLFYRTPGNKDNNKIEFNI